MKRIIYTICILLAACACSTVKDEVKPTKNIIYMLVDGTSEGALSVCRWYKQYTTNTDENLALDPYLCGLCRMSHVNAPIVGSAGSMSTLMTGVLTATGNIGTYPKPHPDMDMMPVDPALTYYPTPNAMDYLRQQGEKSLGIVVTTTFCHATPAATTSHAASRGNYNEIVAQMASMDLSVCFGGGGKHLTPKVRSILKQKGTPLIEGPDFEAFRNYNGDKLWAIMADENLSFEIDRPDNEPSLAEMTTKALNMLSRNKNGFFLMIEGSQVDFSAHANDPATTIKEILAFDEAVKVALDFARKDGNTTVIITPDHGNSGIQLGDKTYQNYSERNIATCLGCLPQCKASAQKMADLMVGRKPSEIAEVIKEYTGIEITAEELKHLIEVSGVKESDYMQVGSTDNLVSSIAKIEADRAHIGFASAKHTGEDVFVSIYNPNDQRPEGYMTGVQINEYIAKIIGTRKPLADYREEYFAADTTLFTNITKGKDEFGDKSITVELADGHQASFSANSCFVIMDNKTIELPRPAVYIPKNKTFYLPSNITELLK